MTRRYDTGEDPFGVADDNPQHLLVLAYTRLFLLPAGADGSKHTVIASFGPYEVRLIQMRAADPESLQPLCIELYDAGVRQVIAGAQCRDLQEAGEATVVFIAEAERLGGIAGD
jgi:hypothetical protein